MDHHQKTAIWLGAALGFVVGLLLLMNDNSAAGIFLLLLAIGSLAHLPYGGHTWAVSHSGLVKWGLVAVPILAAILAIIVGTICLLK